MISWVSLSNCHTLLFLLLIHGAVAPDPYENFPDPRHRSAYSNRPPSNFHRANTYPSERSQEYNRRPTRDYSNQFSARENYRTRPETGINTKINFDRTLAEVAGGRAPLGSNKDNGNGNRQTKSTEGRSSSNNEVYVHEGEYYFGSASEVGGSDDIGGRHAARNAHKLEAPQPRLALMPPKKEDENTPNQNPPHEKTYRASEDPRNGASSRRHSMPPIPDSKQYPQASTDRHSTRARKSHGKHASSSPVAPQQHSYAQRPYTSSGGMPTPQHPLANAQAPLPNLPQYMPPLQQLEIG